MHQDILEFIRSQRVSVVALEMPDGSPHAAALHFAHQEDPFTFIFLTNPKYRKSEALHHQENVRSSLVIGCEEADGKEKTFQLDGTARFIKSEEEHLKKTYFKKFPEKNQGEDVFFIFTPTWWRFTDWGKPEGKTLYTSDGKITVAKK